MAMHTPRPSPYRFLLGVLLVSAAGAPLVAQPLSEPIDVGVGDLDRDALPEVFSANRYSEDLVVRRNPGTGVLLAPTSVPLAPANLGPIVAARGDLDGDGFADDCAVGCNVTNTIALVFDVSGVPTIQTVAAGGIRPRDLVVTDLDGVLPEEVVFGREGDGLGNGEGLAVIRGGGPAQDIAIPAGNPTRVIRIAASDLDGDGFVDLAVAVAGRGEVFDRVLLFRNDGLGTPVFAGAFVLAGVDKVVAVAARDLDGDGWIDLAALSRNNTPTTNLIRIYQNTGSGLLTPAAFTVLDVSSPGRGALDLALGDLDGDGLGDAVVTNVETRDVIAHEGFSATGFATVRTLMTARVPVSVALGDLNGDGLDDVVVADAVAEKILVLRTLGPLSPGVSTLGAGCPGTGGVVPQIATPVLATAGEPAFSVDLSNALPGTPALLLFAGAAGQVPLPGGCTLWLGLPVLQFAMSTTAAGDASVAFGIPNDTAVMGVQLAVQWAVLDPQGAFANTIAFSDGLLVRVGS